MKNDDCDNQTELEVPDFQQDTMQNVSFTSDSNGAGMVAKVKRIFGPRYDRALSDGEARQIVSDYADFLASLAECAQNETNAKLSNAPTLPVHNHK